MPSVVSIPGPPGHQRLNRLRPSLAPEELRAVSAEHVFAWVRSTITPSRYVSDLSCDDRLREIPCAATSSAATNLVREPLSEGMTNPSAATTSSP